MSISKTINVPNETTPEEISKIYLDFIERGI
jgi:ribonucleotide reductase alpha subunit